MAHDTTPRYAPERTFIVGNGKYYNAPVNQYVTHPANNHPAKCPIKAEMVALELVTDYGSAWWGFDHAYINSELRMVVVGFDSRDEIRSKWPIAQYA